LIILYGRRCLPTIFFGPRPHLFKRTRSVLLLKGFPSKADWIKGAIGKETTTNDIIPRAVELEKKETLELMFPMTKDKEVLRKAREEAVDAICGSLRSGKDIACINIGDPMFYSTFSYLIPLLRQRVPDVEIEIVPGISSVMASAAVTVTPLTEADERLAVIPATYESEKIRHILETFDTVVLMKVNRVFDKVLGLLEELDLKENAVFIERCGGENQRVVKNLDSLKGEKLDYLSMVIVKRGS